jgi:hypothetical protein
MDLCGVCLLVSSPCEVTLQDASRPLLTSSVSPHSLSTGSPTAFCNYTNMQINSSQAVHEISSHKYLALAITKPAIIFIQLFLFCSNKSLLYLLPTQLVTAAKINRLPPRTVENITNSVFNLIEKKSVIINILLD